MSTDILILGGTGKTGRRLTHDLSARGATVRVASRHPSGDGGTRHVRFDWDDESTHDAALAGAGAVYVIPPAFVVDHVAATTRFLDRAASSGVERVVFLSARGVDADDAIPLRRVELALLAEPALRGTVIRPTWFAQNFTEGVFAPGVSSGVLAAPAGAGRVPFVDAGDIAAVAAALLVDHDAFVGEALDLSGSTAYGFAEAADVLAGALGHDVAYVDVAPPDFVAGAVAAGVPADYAGMLGALFEVVRNGWDEHESDGIDRVLGRPGRSLAEWAATLAPVTPAS